MKTILLIMALAGSARAQGPVFTTPTLSSVTWANVVVSSLTPVRVDNFNVGVTSAILNGRTNLVITAPHGAPGFVCNYELVYATSTTGKPAVLISTITGNSSLGAEYIAPSATAGQWTIPIGSLQSFWCQGEGPTNATINVQQVSPFRPSGRLPGSP